MIAVPPVVRRLPHIVVGFALAACASTTAPSPPPLEALLVVNGGDNSVIVAPIDSLRPNRLINLGIVGPVALDVAARGQTALVTGGTADVVYVLDLVLSRLVRTIPVAAGSRPTGVTIISDALAYVTAPGTNTVIRVDYLSGDTASVAVGQYPVDVVLTRGRVFVVNANIGPCATGLCPLGESWLTVIDPVANTRAQGKDSIPLPGPGQARAAEVGADGLIYIISTGDIDAGELGRLTIVDPVRREEVGSFGGFGTEPVSLASDGRERLFVTSVIDGLMEFNTRTRRVIRGAGSGVLLPHNVAAAVDTDGRIYAIESGGCVPGVLGRLRLLRSDLTEARSLVLGQCPTAAIIVKLPPPTVVISAQ